MVTWSYIALPVANVVAPSVTAAVFKVAPVPNPKLLLASLALDAPVPPLATAKSVPDQLELFIVDNVDKEPSPKLLLAPLAELAPVPPFATAKSVPDQFELLIVELPPIAVKLLAAVEPSPTYKALVSLLYISSPAAGVPALERLVPLLICNLLPINY